MATFGQRLREARKARGLRVNELDRKAEVSPGTTSRFENERRGAKTGGESATTNKFAIALGVRLAWLIDGTGAMDQSAEEEPEGATPAQVAAAKLALLDGINPEAVREVASIVRSKGPPLTGGEWYARMRARAQEMAEGVELRGEEVDLPIPPRGRKAKAS